jgi:hypothetical protein
MAAHRPRRTSAPRSAGHSHRRDAARGPGSVLRGAIPIGHHPAPYDFTWAFILRDQGDSTTRLVVRERYSYLRRWAPLLVEPTELVSWVMSQRMLRGIKQRAEHATPTRQYA